QGAARIEALRRCSTVTPDGIRACVARSAVDDTLILVDGRNLSPAALTAVLVAAEEAVTAARPAVTVAVTARAGNASAWIGHAQRIELARVDHAGLRMWCDEENLPFRDDEARTRLLAVTGGWPAVVTRTAELAAAAAPTARSSRLLADTGTW